MKRALFFSALLISGCSTTPNTTEPDSASGKSRSQPVWVVDHGWHAGIVIRREALQFSIPSIRKTFPEDIYLEVGWGDAEFYQAQQITPQLVAQAVLWPSSAVLHVAGFDKDPRQYFPRSEVVCVNVSAEEYGDLVRFIGSSFARDGEDRLIPLKRGMVGHSRFYQARGLYHAFNNCNQWTAQALASAGIKVNTFFTLTSDILIRSLPKKEPDQCLQ